MIILSFVRSVMKSLDRPFSGKFNLRLDPALHREVSIVAKKHQMSLNEWVSEAIKHHLHE